MNYVSSNKSGSLNKEQLKRLIFIVLIGFTVVQQMPLIKDIYYQQIRAVLYIGFGLFSAVSYFSIGKYSKINSIRYFILTIAYSVLLFIVIKVFSDGVVDIFELAIPFGVLICSLNTNFNKKQLSHLLIGYVLLSVVLGISSIFYYGEGFIITRNYFLSGKNQIGPLLGISTVITGIWILDKNQFDLKYNSQIFKITMFLLLITSIIVIRNRSGLLGIFIVTLTALMKEYKFKKSIINFLMIYVILFSIILLSFYGLFDGLVDAIFKSFFFNYDLNDINSISAGRTAVYDLAFDFALKYPILGELEAGKFIYSIPHNYILNKWVKYGIVGSLPIILFYLYLWFFTLRRILWNRYKINYSLPIWVLMFSLIVSIFEYTYPFGPGVSQLMVWFLLGQYFRYNFNEFS